MTVRTNGRVMLLLIAAACAGCGPDGGLVTGLPDGQPERLPEVALPAPVSDAWFATALDPFQPRVQWGDNGRTIHFMPNVGPSFGVHRLDVATGVADVIVAGAGNVLHISDDREFLYYTFGQGSHAIYRLATAGGQPELLVTAAQHVFAISENGRWLAWAGSHVDSLYVRDLETDETSAVTARSVPLSISPDGLHLVHTSERGAVLTSLATGTTTDLERPGTRVLDVRWAATGVEVLVRGIDFLEIARPGSGDPVRLWTSSNHLMVDAAAWSPDGAQVVASLSAICLSQCTSWLLRFDRESGSQAVLASTRDFIGMARFTPDGQTISITSGGRLYVLPLPDA